MQNLKFQIKIMEFWIKKLTAKTLPRSELRSTTWGYKLKTAQGGFTLLETFIAITILMFAVVGPLTIVSKALNASYDSRDQITAFYLAQDAIEYIRNVRDGNSLAGNPSWTTFLETGTTLSIDSNISPGEVGGIQNCSGESCRLRYNASTGLYGHVVCPDCTDSIFKREIRMDTVPSNPDEISVSVKVIWRSPLTPSQDKFFEIRENIFNWQEQN